MVCFGLIQIFKKCYSLKDTIKKKHTQKEKSHAGRNYFPNRYLKKDFSPNMKRTSTTKY